MAFRSIKMACWPRQMEQSSNHLCPRLSLISNSYTSSFHHEAFYSRHGVRSLDCERSSHRCHWCR